MIRLLVVAPLYHPDRGGLGRQAVLLTERLAALGVRATVATRRMTGLRPRRSAPGVEVVEVAAGRPAVHNYEARSPRNLVTSLRFSGGVARLLLRRRGAIDVVHFHGASLPLVATLPAAALAGARVVAKVAALHQGVEAGDLGGRYGPVGPLLVRVLRRVDAFVATTAEIEAALRTEGYGRIARIPNFVDVERFRPPSPADRAALRAELGLSGRTVAIHSGRLTARKGAGHLLDGFARALRAVPGAEPHLLFLGDGPERPALEARARALGLAGRVDFLGFHDDVERYLGAADVFALSSSIEGLPNALLEAMGVGLPAVATRIGGALEALGEREGAGGGLLVPPGDGPAMGEALAALLGDAERRARLGAAARRRIEERFALEAVAPRYVALYRELLGSRGGSEARGGSDAPP